jgi:hypothetical protein
VKLIGPTVSHPEKEDDVAVADSELLRPIVLFAKIETYPYVTNALTTGWYI